MRSPLNTAYVPASVTWSLSGNAETLAVSKTRVVAVNGETFYLTRIPFETRQLADHTPLAASPNTLALPSTAISFTRNAIVDGQAAEFVNPADAVFTFGSADLGLIQRVDLRLPNAPPDIDSDSDGMSDAAELLAGTDPHDSDSVLRGYTDLHPALVGGAFAGIVIEWQSVPGKRYRVERATELGKPFVPVGPVVSASGARTQFRDDTATGSGPFFYRIQVE